MQKWIKGGLIFVGGFASGVVTSYFAARYFLDIQWIEPDENQEESIEKENETEEPNVPVNKPADALSEKYDKVEDNPDYVNYNKLRANYITESVSEDVYDNVIPDNVDIFGDPKDPHIINEETFGENYDYDETYIKYYKNDELLTDDWDYPIDDEIMVIGEEAKTKLLEGDSDVVYVKNDKLKAYYRIAVQHEDYPGISG